MSIPEKKEFFRRLGVVIKDIRTESGISQEQMLADTGIDIDPIELGHKSFTTKTLFEICSYFGVTLVELAKRTGM